MIRSLRVLLAFLLAAVLLPGPASAEDPVPPPSVWVFGDSIAAGTWLSDPATEAWPNRLDARMGPGTQVRNLAEGGQAVAYSGPGLNRMDYAVRYWLNATPREEHPEVVVFAGGINDLIHSADVGPTRWAVYDLGGWIAANYPHVGFMVTTLTPLRADHRWAISDRRTAYNSWARSMYGPSGQLIDSGDILTAGDWADVRFMADSLHPDAEGAEQLAHGIGDVLEERGYL